MKKLLGIALIAILVAFAVYRVVERIDEKKQSQTKSDDRIPVATMLVERGTVVDALRLTGTVAAQTSITLYSNIPGQVTRIAKKAGDPVVRNEVIARVKCTQPELLVSQLEAAAGAAKSGLMTVESTYRRTRALRENNAIAEAQWEAVAAQHDSAKARLDQVNAQLQLARSQRGDCSLRSPLTGVVSAVYLEEGDIISGAQMSKTSPLASVMTVGHVKVEVGVDERLLARVDLGQTANIFVDAYPRVPFIGEVNSIAPVVDARSRTATVEIRVDNADGRLVPGMFARVRIVHEQKQDVVIVPVDTLLEMDQLTLAFVAENGTAKRRQVELGIREGKSVEIRRGLSPGERLVVLGQQRLRDGVAIVEGVLPETVRRELGLSKEKEAGVLREQTPQIGEPRAGLETSR